MTIDLDYADGLSRANTIVSIFDSSGALVYMGRDSNISDDRSAPLNGADLDDLSRGTVGPHDGFIGPIELAVGKYFLAVSSNNQVPAPLDQFFSANPNNTTTRLEPINTVRRIADEQFGADTNRTGSDPIVDLFTTTVDANGNVVLDPAHKDFELSDVSLYVSASAMTAGSSGIYQVDGFTGGVQAHVGQFAQTIDDIAFRPDGELFTYANSPFPPDQFNDMGLGHYAQINTENGAITDIGDDGPTTWVAGQCLPAPAVGVQQAQVGINYTALHFTGTAANDGLAVGHNRARSGNAYPSYFEFNALYNFNIQTGATINQEILPRLGDARACDGAHTNLYEVGKIDTVPDGVIQGLAEVGDQLYGLDQFGNLYAIDYTLGPFPGRSVTTTSIKQVIDRPFSGLVAGPGAGTEGGAYENLLFGLTSDGDIYVFDTNGDLQPVLAGGNFMVSTGIQNADGIAFGTLDYNLWEVTTGSQTTADRGADPGHGTQTTPDNSRLPTAGGTSLFFGNQTGGADAGNKNGLNPAVQRNINFPGGAQGELVSNEFSLKGYNSADKPTLYFNYFLETEGSDGAAMTDAFRVYVGGDDTIVDPATGLMTPWSLLATNNSLQQSGDANDEFDYGVGPLPTDFPDTQSFANVQPVFDNSNAWRQVRVDLSDFAGQDSLRLRFVFASAGTLNLGQRATQNPLVFTASGGEELYSLPGKDLRDGEQFTLQGVDGTVATFTFDLGYTLVVPSGGTITDGDTFTVDGVAFEFDSDGSTSVGLPVAFSTSMTANEVARSLRDSVETILAGTVLATRDENRVNLSNATSLTQTGALTIEGAPGGGANLVPVNSGMTRTEVAAQMRVSIADTLANGVVEAVQGINNQIRLPAMSILDPGPLPAGNMLPGDEFGFADSPIAGPSPRGSNNNVNGVYVDDIIIGFAERGEMATNAPNNSGFIDNAEVTNAATGGPPDILVGPYDVELRRAGEYGFSQEDDPNLVLTRTIDTNDRVGNMTSLTVPSGGDIADGETFSLSDGTNIVVFEFDDIRAGNGTQPGHFGILFDPFAGATGDEKADPDQTIAARVRDAINSPAVQGILNVVAGISDGTASGGGSTGNTVNIYGNAVVDLEKPVADTGVLGEINPVSALNSDDLFTFENHSSAGERISAITLVLPDGLYFDPDPGSGAPNDSGADGASGPDVSAASGSVGETFTFQLNNAGIRDTVDIAFTGFDAGEVFEFGVDIEPVNDPSAYIGTRYEIVFDSGRIVSGFFQVTQDANADAHDDVIDPTRRDFAGVLGGSLFLTEYTDFGDQNNFRDQGQVLIQQNSITDSAEFGIVIDAGQRSPTNIPLGGTLPHQGPVRNLQELNTDNLVPGVIVENNIVARGGTGGIRFSGDATTGVIGPVPYGRIINNTVVGLNGAGTGILVSDKAGPTLLNNIVSDLAVGIEVAGDSQATTVIGTTLYRGNAADANTGGLGLGTFAIVLGAGDPLYIDAANGNYYPAPQSPTIDSSLDSLGDRTAVTRVKNPLGISVSPILAPQRDVFGQFRGDDPAVSPPNGLGANVFKDRGAIDRVDFFQPFAVIANPEDGAVNDLDPDPNEIWIDEPETLRQFIVRLEDEGIGVDDTSVTSSAFRLFQDGVQFVDGVDYLFTYNSNTKEAVFTAVTTFEFERSYRIDIDNDDAFSDADGVDGVRDRAGNFLAPNQTDGTTQFFVLVTDGVNDPPENSVPADQTLPEDSQFVFQAVDGTEITVSDPDVHLGNNRLQVTLTATDGTLTLGSLVGLSFTSGDGLNDTVMSFNGDVDDLNNALEGLTFTPTAEFVGPATVEIRTEDNGQFAGPPPTNEQDVDTVTLNYFGINDEPTFDLPGDPAAPVIEDAGPQAVPNFAANMDAGAPNEGGQNLSFVVTLLSTTGNLSFLSGPAIDAITGELTYQTSLHTNGTATFQVVLQDDGANGGADDNTSQPRQFTLVVSPINDEPNFDFFGNANPPAVDEDAGEQTVAGYVTNVVPGPPEATDEVGQNLSLDFRVVSTTGNLSFTKLEIDPATGDLTYEAAPDTAGAGLISVTIFDDGLASPAPNDNQGPTKLFTIFVNSVDDAPVAVTPDYTIDHGDALQLDGTGSSDVDIPLGDSLTYRWDLNGDGDFTDATGATPVVPFSDLVSFGFNVPDVRNIRLRVLDEPDGAGVRRKHTVSATVTVLAVDYGDAPSSFGTDKPNGAAHVIFPGFSLGTTVDSDVDGQDSPGFNGDDLDGTDDEDGVVFHTTIEASAAQPLASPFTVDVTAPFAGKLDVWVDFNNDGQFDPLTEHANGGLSYDVFNGTQILPMTVPAGAHLGTVAARFRLSTSGGLAPTGRAEIGEVEDHEVTIIQVQAPVVPVFSAPGAVTTDRTPTFEWSDATANTSYQFNLFDPSGALIEDRENLGGTEFTVATDLPYGVYTARVRSFNRAGTASDWSDTRVLSIAPVAPSVETPVGRVPDSTPTFTWTPVADVEGYRLQVDNLTTGQDGVVQVDVTTTFYTSVDELPLGEYRVRVQAFGGSVFSDFSTEHFLSVTTPPAITSPDTLTFDSTPTIQWDAPFGAGTYQVRVRVNGQSANLINETGITDTSFTVGTPLGFGTYRVLVRATAAGDPAFFGDSDSLKFKIVVRPTVTSPAGRTADSTPTVKWTAVAGGESYEVRVHNLSTGENNVVRVAGIQSLSHTLPELPVGRYVVSVRARNPLGELSLWSPGRIFRIVTSPVSQGPSGSFFDQQPVFTWNSLDGSDRYELRVHKLLSGGDPNDPNAGINNFIRLVLPAAATSYGSPYQTSLGQMASLPNSSYRWWVRGITADGIETNWSQPLEFVVGGRPTLEEIGTTTDTTPTFTWQPVLDADRYILRVRRVSDNAVVLRETNLTGTQFTPTTPLPKGEFRAWLRAVSTDGTVSAWSVPVDLNIVSATPMAPEGGAVLPLDVPAAESTEAVYFAQTDLPAIALPVVVAEDPAIEVLAEPVLRLPLAAGTDAPAIADLRALDQLHCVEAGVGLMEGESVAAVTDHAPSAEVTPSRVAAGVMGGLLSAGWLRRRRTDDDKQPRRTR